MQWVMLFSRGLFKAHILCSLCLRGEWLQSIFKFMCVFARALAAFLDSNNHGLASPGRFQNS